MKPDREKYLVESTLEGEEVAMTLEATATAHLMGVMTELYSDREMAVLREYATNALDAHVVAGIARPIDITLPSRLSPTLTIRDYGAGLSADDIRTIYSRYGASTKRDSNDAVGMLGLGCKSGLAYADTFTLTSVHEGQRIAVAVSRDEEGGGTMNILEQTATDEESGVRVEIPVGAYNAFAEKAEQLFRHWAPGTVLVNGEEPARFTNTLELSPRLLLVGDRELDESVVVMGNVPYPAPELDELLSFPYGVALVARVPIGTVQFTPSREALMDTARTRKALAAIAEEYQAESVQYASTAIARATTPGEAVTELLTIENMIGRVEKPEWQGRELPRELAPWDGLHEFKHLPKRSYSYSSDNRHSNHRTLPFKTAVHAVWVTSFDNANWTAPMRRKLDAYAAAELNIERSAEREYVLVSTPTVASEWLSAVTTCDWADVRKWKDPSGTTGPALPGETYAGTYPAYWTDGSWKKKRALADIREAVDDGTPVFYVEGSAAEHYGIAEQLDGAILVELSAPRKAKFLRLVPEAEQYAPELERRMRQWWTDLSDEQRAGLRLRPQYVYPWERNPRPHEVAKLDAARVADPELAEFIRACDAYDRDLALDYQERERWLPQDVLAAAARREEPFDIAKRYPLLNVDEPDDTYLYIAAKVAADDRSKA